MERSIPAVGPAPPVRLPKPSERRLRGGLRMVAVRRALVPRFEARLRIPAGPAHDTGPGVVSRLVPETLLAGTRDRSSLDVARTLQRLGASLDAHITADDLVLAGGGLAANLRPFLELMVEVVASASFPSDEVAVARDRLVQEIVIQRSQPGWIAREAFLRRYFGRHPYGRGLPDPDAVRRASAATLRRFHAERVLPRSSHLVLVGDIRPERALDIAGSAFASWRGRGKASRAPSPDPPGPRPTLLVDRPGAVQTNIRVGGPALPRTDPAFFDILMANTVFGGYFSSRLVENIRERRGYTYSPRSGVEHYRTSSLLFAAADVATEVTAPALVEIRYELQRMAAAPIEQHELDSARRYMAGALALSVQTQSGLADQLDALAAAGLGIDYIRDFRRNLDRVSVASVREAASRFLSPRRLLTVLVGDATHTAAHLEALEEVEVRR